MASKKLVRRRRCDDDLKVQVVAECDAPGASVAKVAMARSINANVVRRWLQLAREGAQVDARAVAVIRVDSVWLAVVPLDMRAGTEAASARVVGVFSAGRPHHAYVFVNRRANRMKVLVLDGIGVRLAARRLHCGKFVWLRDAGTTLTSSRAQFDALVLGLPWQCIGEAGVVAVL